jgi:hypothetical protein
MPPPCNVVVHDGPPVSYELFVGLACLCLLPDLHACRGFHCLAAVHRDREDHCRRDPRQASAGACATGTSTSGLLLINGKPIPQQPIFPARDHLFARDTIMREIVIDTETTGLDPTEGHRVVEIGAVELVNRSLTGQTFHRYVCPQGAMPADAVARRAYWRVLGRQGGASPTNST